VASEIQKLAEAIRSVGDSAGPAQRELAEAARLARSLAQSVPRGGGQAGSAVLAALAEAERKARAAGDALARFDSRADAFARRLAGESGGGTTARAVLGAVKNILVAGAVVPFVAFTGGDVAPQLISRTVDQAMGTPVSTVRREPLQRREPGTETLGTRLGDLVQDTNEGIDKSAELHKKRDEILEEIRKATRRPR